MNLSPCPTPSLSKCPSNACALLPSAFTPYIGYCVVQLELQERQDTHILSHLVAGYLNPRIASSSDIEGKSQISGTDCDHNRSSDPISNQACVTSKTSTTLGASTGPTARISTTAVLKPLITAQTDSTRPRLLLASKTMLVYIPRTITGIQPPLSLPASATNPAHTTRHLMVASRTRKIYVHAAGSTRASERQTKQVCGLLSIMILKKGSA